MNDHQDVIAYFSMEFAFESDMPNYAGGLGVLAADTMLSCADLEMNVVGISLMYHQDDNLNNAFFPKERIQLCPESITVPIEDRLVQVSIWKYEITGKTGHVVPVYFLSSYLDNNPKWDRDLTKFLYASDRYTRLGQEAILGIGGVRALNALGYTVKQYHMNEGHSALLTLELLKNFNQDKKAVQSLCTFTTHTPIAAGHDYFDYHLANKTLSTMLPDNIKTLASPETFGMTQLALSMSNNINAVSQKHRDVCQNMFPSYHFEGITNGIYHPRWIGKYMKKLLDVHISDWEEKPNRLQQDSLLIPNDPLLDARNKEKSDLVHWINTHHQFFPVHNAFKDDHFDKKTLTIGFARRFVPYKRPDLIFRDLDRLRELGYQRLQLVFAGRCHPDDQFCNNLRASIGHYAQQLRGQIRVAMIPEYNLEIGKRLVTGCDVWLNNPLPPREASGTSGMKAALNGVLNLSILDGWWIEAYKMDPLSGWAFGEKDDVSSETRDDSDRNQLMDCLEDILDCYYHNKGEWAERMKHAIGLASYFNTHRMAKEYMSKMWN